MSSHRTHRKNVKKRKNRRFYAQFYASWMEKQSENQWELEQMQSEENSQRVHEKWMLETINSQSLRLRQKGKIKQFPRKKKAGGTSSAKVEVKGVKDRNMAVPGQAGHDSKQPDILLIQEIRRRAYKAMQDAAAPRRVQATLCPFYVRTGCCPFGKHRCDRSHQAPKSSKFLLLKHFCLDEILVDGSTTELLYEMSAELSRIAAIVRVELVQNLASHLRGNVYIEFKSEEGAKEAWQALRVRYYKGRIIDAELVPIVHWEASICGSFVKGACARENCNYLHLNPHNLNEISLERRNTEKRGCFEDIVQYFERPSSRNAQK